MSIEVRSEIIIWAFKQQKYGSPELTFEGRRSNSNSQNFRSQTIHSFNFECILFKAEINNLIGILYPNHRSAEKPQILY